MKPSISYIQVVMTLNYPALSKTAMPSFLSHFTLPQADYST